MLNKPTKAGFFKSQWEFVLLSSGAPAGICNRLELGQSHHAMPGGAPRSD